MAKPVMMPVPVSKGKYIYIKEKLHKDIMKKLKDAIKINYYVSGMQVVYEFETLYSKGKFVLDGQERP
jgi:hypothetical protein